MFRDDHEAALARLEAAEAELARERSKDVKQEERLAKLERELAAAKAKLRQTEDELAKHRPPPPKPTPRPKVENQFDRAEQAGPKYAAIGVGIFLVAIVVVGLALMATGKQDKPTEPPETPHEIVQESLPDGISELLPEIRERGDRALIGSRMIELRGTGITSEGRLHEQYGELRATFYRTDELREPEVDPKLPVGAAPPVEHSSFDRHKCAYVVRKATEWLDSPLGDFSMCVMGDLYESRSALEPRCTMKTIWQRAIADGAPADAIAEITLEQSTWRFEINDQRLRFDRRYVDDCRR